MYCHLKELGRDYVTIYVLLRLCVIYLFKPQPPAIFETYNTRAIRFMVDEIYKIQT